MPSVNLTTLPYLPYGYVPTKWLCIMFVVLFSISTLMHLVQARRYSTRWLISTVVVCGIAEIIGWIGRLKSSDSPYLLEPFIVQCVLVIVSPSSWPVATVALTARRRDRSVTTISAPGHLFIANFIIFVRITKRLGQQFLRPSPKTFKITAIISGAIAITITAIGAILVSTSSSQRKLGSHIALGGMALQLLLMTLYIALAADFVVRFTSDRSARGNNASRSPGAMDESITRMLFAMFTVVILLYIRSIYRVVGLSEGYRSKVTSTEWPFAVFDGGLVVLAMFTLNLFHPGVLLVGPDELVADVETVEYLKLRTSSSTANFHQS